MSPDRTFTVWSTPALGKGEPDSVVRCVGCHRELDVNFAACIAVGWPKCWCNGLTMTLISSDADIDVEMGKVIRASREADRR